MTATRGAFDGGAFDGGQLASLACLLEVTAPKPGNVHRGADFEDVTFEDFVISAMAIQPAIRDAPITGIGASVLAAISATQAAVGTNTNLGMVLLLAPLSAALAHCPHAIPSLEQFRGALATELRQLTPQDAVDVFAAVRLAHPGGLGRVEEADVFGDPPDDLREAMRLAADRDLIARQYVTDFEVVFEDVVPRLRWSRGQGWSWSFAIVHTQLHVLAKHPDTLIARKVGLPTAQRAATMAAAVLGAGPPDSEEYCEQLRAFDFWLRSDGHRRNPGTTADLLAAGLFVLLAIDPTVAARGGRNTVMDPS